jgi:hypothetical protein
MICVAISLAGSILGGLIAGAVLLWLNAAHGDWLGFAGGVTGGAIGGAMTIGAGYLAWRGVREQNELTRTMLRDRADESAMRLRLSIRRTKDFIREARGHLAVIIHRPNDGRTVLAYDFHVIQARYAALAAIDQADPRLRDLLADEMSDVRVSCVRLPAVQTTVELAEAGPIEHEIAVLDGALDRLSAALHQATTPVALNMLRTHSTASA